MARDHAATVHPLIRDRGWIVTSSGTDSVEKPAHLGSSSTRTAPRSRHLFLGPQDGEGSCAQRSCCQYVNKFPVQRFRLLLVGSSGTEQPSALSQVSAMVTRRSFNSALTSRSVRYSDASELESTSGQVHQILIEISLSIHYLDEVFLLYIHYLDEREAKAGAEALATNAYDWVWPLYVE